MAMGELGVSTIMLANSQLSIEVVASISVVVVLQHSSQHPIWISLCPW